MKLNNYIRTYQGAVTIVHGVDGYSLMVDTRKELIPEDWDAAISRCFQRGWELVSDEPDTTAGPWEFWFMSRVPDAA